MAPSTLKRRLTSLIRKLVVLVAATGAAAAIAAVAWYRPALQPVDPTAQKTMLVHVRPGASARQIVDQLAAAGLIRSPAAATIYAFASGTARGLKAGYYDLSPALSVPELLAAIASGDVATRQVVVVPGLKLDQIASRVKRAGLLHADEFLDATRRAADYGDAVDLPLPEEGTVEGYLFPATYTFPIDLPASEIVRRMLQAFSTQFYRPHRDEIERSQLSLHEIVTLASMVEREAARDDERPIIAGVLVNRLRLGWRLQCDATVLYALGHHKPRLTYRDLTVDSPYNTYLHTGLPPGPICSPGLPSLLAALRPAQHDYLFYVARGDGRHVFTRTYAEHLAAISRIRGKRQERPG